ncbi:MAG: HAMP domain-containing histidine kinase [Desulfobacterales bacterium]|nr:HAMP domain-containing histidine kinase [Desulfobacterales bacterium]
MKFYQSIRFRLMGGILIFGLIMGLATGGLAFYIAESYGEQITNNLIETEIDYFLYQYETNRATPLPRSKYISAFDGIERVPGQLRSFLKDLEPGVYEVEINETVPPFMVGVFEMPDTKEVYYLIFNTEAFLKDSHFLRPKEILMISLGLMLILGFIIGTLVFNAVLFRPVNDLIVKVRGLNPESIPGQWDGSGTSGEIGILTQTIESTMNRIRKFIEREKEFTRDASHELRTPLTVVKGAMEILEEQQKDSGNTQMGKPLNRIRRSVKNMENLIETFLWLAREEDDPGQSSQVAAAVRKAVENNRYLIENKAIKVNIDIRQDRCLPVKEEILYITVANLVRNAFQFTPRGSVSITAERDCLSITDTGTGIDPDKLDSVTRSHIKGKDSRGFGLGLNIVSRLCERFGWELDIQSLAGQGTRINIRWPKNNQAKCPDSPEG